MKLRITGQGLTKFLEALVETKTPFSFNGEVVETEGLSKFWIETTAWKRGILSGIKVEKA